MTQHPTDKVSDAMAFYATLGLDVGYFSALWHTFNVVQENVLRGGIPRRSASNRLSRTRRITAIREDVRLNSALWELAIARAA